MRFEAKVNLKCVVKNSALIKRLETTDLVHPFCFTDEETETQRSYLACPVSHRKLVSS